MAVSQGKTKQLNITDAAIKRHAADVHLNQLRDTTIGRLYLRYHESRQKGSWYLIGKRGQWRKLARWPEVPASIIKPEAAKFAARLDDDQVIETEQTLGHVIRWFEQRTEQERTLTPERRSDVLGIIRNHLASRPELMDLRLTGLRKRDLDRHLMLPLQRRYKPATVSKIFQVLKTATKRARTLEVIQDDPLARFYFGDFVDAPLEPKPAALRTENAGAVLEQISIATNRQAALLAMLITLHGTRINETRLATWRDFDLTSDWWYIPAAHTKTRHALRLPVSDQAKAVLLAFKPSEDATGPVFKGAPGQPITRQAAQNYIREIGQRQWSAHDLRKMARTVWADLGIDYMTAELLLNHTPSKLDRTYIHTYADKKAREALTIYHDWLERKAGKPLANLVQGVDGETAAIELAG